MIEELRARMDKRIKMLPNHLLQILESRNGEEMPLIDFLTIGCFKKGALDKSLADAKKFVGVPKSYVRRL